MSEGFYSVIDDLAKRAENAHDLAMDDPDSTTHCDAISTMLTGFVRRLVSAHDAEIKDLRSACEADGENCRIAIQSAQARFDEELVCKDAEIARLKAALKPVLECDTKIAFSTANTIANHGDLPSGIDYDMTSNGIYRVCNAVREAKRIYNEGGAK